MANRNLSENVQDDFQWWRCGIFCLFSQVVLNTSTRSHFCYLLSSTGHIEGNIQGCGPTFAIFSVVRDIPQPGGDVKAWNIGKKRYQSATVSASLMQLDKEQDKVKSAKLCVVNIINFPKICSSNSFLTSLKDL